MNTRYPSHARSIAALWLLALVMLAGPALAAVPSTVSYQGYLTNTAGAPLDGSYFIQFAIYNVDAGGVPLWSDTQTVTVSKGLLSVQLGDPGAPFPLGLFDDPLWLGIDVEGDGEMSPRRPFDSVAFAFKANDAMTLEGQGVASLDQSAHVTEFDNPHAVTAAQTGALSGAELSVHAGEPTAHHSRYADGEAVDAIKAADGPESGLDADLLDGSDSTAFAPTGHAHNAAYYAQSQVDALLASRDALIDDLNGRLEDLEKILAKVSASPDGSHIYITGANLYVRNGSGDTFGATTNGLGNLIVGYNETRGVGFPSSCSLGEYTTQEDCEANGGVWAIDHKSGSHNVVVGPWNNYSHHGGLVVGIRNTISGNYASVSGGSTNTASGSEASVSGGRYNTASGRASSVLGGGGVVSETEGNHAFADFSAIAGGRTNLAGDPNLTSHSLGNAATIGGGQNNTASGVGASVSGGYDNTASGSSASVSGGMINIAGGINASVSGGRQNTAAGDNASVSGGRFNTASGVSSSVLGGGGDSAATDGNQALADHSAIVGGRANLTGDPNPTLNALVDGATIGGGQDNTANVSYASVSGGRENTASAADAWVGGGVRNQATGAGASVSGGHDNTAGGQTSSVSAGAFNQATETNAAVSGGRENIASGNAASVSGGLQHTAPGTYDWAAGSLSEDQ